MKGIRIGDKVTLRVVATAIPHGDPRDCGGLLCIPAGHLDGPWLRVIKSTLENAPLTAKARATIAQIASDMQGPINSSHVRRQGRRLQKALGDLSGNGS